VVSLLSAFGTLYHFIIIHGKIIIKFFNNLLFAEIHYKPHIDMYVSVCTTELQKAANTFMLILKERTSSILHIVENEIPLIIIL